MSALLQEHETSHGNDCCFIHRTPLPPSQPQPHPSTLQILVRPSTQAKHSTNPSAQLHAFVIPLHLAISVQTPFLHSSYISSVVLDLRPGYTYNRRVVVRVARLAGKPVTGRASGACCVVGRAALGCNADGVAHGCQCCEGEVHVVWLFAG